MALFGNFLSKKDNSKSKVDKDFSMADPSDQTETGQTTLLADSLKTENDKGDFSIDPVNSQTEYDGSSMSFDDFINDVIADLRVRLENDFENTKKSFANQNMADHVFTVNNAGGNREELSQSDETGGDMDLKAEEAIDVKEEAGTLKTEELLKELSDFAEELDLKMLFCDGKEDEDNVEEKTAVEIPADSMPVEEDQAEIDHPEDALLLEEVTAEVFSDEKNSLPDPSLPDDSFKADRKEEKTATDSLKELTEEFSGIEPAKTGQEKPEFVKNDISHTGLSDEVNENDYIDFIDETLRRPLFNEKLLEESKRIVVDSIKRKLDKPNYFAMNGFYNEVSKDDIRFDVYVNLEPNDIYQLSLDDIVDTYNKLFKSRVDIYVIGDYTNNLINYLKRYSSNEDLYCLVEPLKLSLRNEIKITKEVGQSTLIVSYKTPYVRTSKDYYAFNLGNILFGGIPTSLLFSEVREKDNLCYLIYSRGLRYEGLVYVETLIDYNNKTKALEEIRNQFNKVIKKEYDPNLLEIAKKMLISNSLTIDDDMDYLVSYHYEGNLSNSYVSINDYIKEVEKITVDDVARVFSNYEEYLVYYLEGTKDE